MLLRLAPWVALLVALAGCAAPEDVPVDADSNESAATSEPAVDTGDVPMSADAGAVPHLHDYWADRERVILFEGELEPTMDDAMNSTGYWVFGERQAAVGGMAFDLPPGAIVFEGTGQMEVTATWSDPRTTGLAVSYRTAASAEFSEPVPLTSAVALVLDVAPEMTDMPHQTTSRWGFLFTAAPPGAALGPFTLSIAIVKMRDVSLFPGHPDFFGNATELGLHDASHEFSQVSYAKRTPQLALDGEFQETEVVPSHIVPMETKWMRAEVTVTRAESTPGQIVDVRFFYHGADRTYNTHPYYLPVNGSYAEGRMVFEFPVTHEMTDSPYLSESQWRFLVEPVTSMTGQDPACGGCTDTTFGFTLKLTAFNTEKEGPWSEPGG